MSETVEWLAGVNAILGAWLIAIPFIFTGEATFWTGFAFWNYVLVGGGIVLFSGYNWWSADESDAGSEWAAAGSVILGLWMIVLPFVTNISAERLFIWNDVLVGAAVAILAGYNVLVTYGEKSTSQATTA